MLHENRSNKVLVIIRRQNDIFIRRNVKIDFKELKKPQFYSIQEYK